MAEDNNPNEQEIQSNATVVVFDTMRGDESGNLKLGTLTNDEVFDYYRELTGPQTMHCICRDIIISVVTHKLPGDDQQQLSIESKRVRYKPLCTKEQNPRGFIEEFGAYGPCIPTFKAGKCPDPFMRALGCKFLPDVYKGNNQR